MSARPPQVVKLGGRAALDPAALSALADALGAAAAPRVVVHGGGLAIGALQERLGLETVYVDGLRVTDAAAIDVVEMVLSGHANKRVVAALVTAGVDALGLSGVDRGLLRCRPLAHPTADLGYVGDAPEVRREVLTALLDAGVTPVVSPISLGPGGRPYNVNADVAAAAVAVAIGAPRLELVSDVPGVRVGGAIRARLSCGEVEGLVADGVVTGGMIPKLRAAAAAVAAGVPRVRIVDPPGLAGGGGTEIGP